MSRKEVAKNWKIDLGLELRTQIMGQGQSFGFFNSN